MKVLRPPCCICICLSLKETVGEDKYIKKQVVYLQDKYVLCMPWHGFHFNWKDVGCCVQSSASGLCNENFVRIGIGRSIRVSGPAARLSSPARYVTALLPHRRQHWQSRALHQSSAGNPLFFKHFLFRRIGWPYQINLLIICFCE